MRNVKPVTLLALIAFSTALAAGGEDKKAPRVADLTEVEVKTHVDAYLKKYRDDDKLKPFSKLELTTEQLVWDRSRTTVIWKVKPKSTMTLSDEDKIALETDLQTLLSNIFNQYEGGIAGDIGTVKINTTVRIVPEKPKENEKPEARPRIELARYWFYYPAPCGSCCRGYFYLKEVYIPVYRYPQTEVLRTPLRTTETVASPSHTRVKDTTTTSISELNNPLKVSTRVEPIRVRPRLNLQGKTAEDAPEIFWYGHKLYWQRNYSAALSYLEAATTLANNDARYWYYRSLTELALGMETAAIGSARRGLELEKQEKPARAVLGRSLERVQGSLRSWLREAGLSVSPNGKVVRK